MAKKPEPLKPVTWDVYRAPHKPKIVGSVQAVDADEAVQKAAQEFKVDAWRLIAGAAAMSLILRKSSTQARIEGRNPTFWPDDDFAIVDADIPVGRIYRETHSRRTKMALVNPPDPRSGTGPPNRTSQPRFRQYPRGRQDRLQDSLPAAEREVRRAELPS